MNTDIWMSLVAVGLSFASIALIWPQRPWKNKAPKLSREELKKEKKRLNRLLKTDHDKAIIELAQPQYDSILQALAKSHKRDEQLVALSNNSIKERSKRSKIRDILDDWEIPQDDARTARYMSRTPMPAVKPPRGIESRKLHDRSDGVHPVRRPPKPVISELQRRVLKKLKTKSFTDLSPTNYREIHEKLKISGDGLVQYVYDIRNLCVDVFTLSTPFDISTSTYHATYGLDEITDKYEMSGGTASGKFEEAKRLVSESIQRKARDALRDKKYKTELRNKSVQVEIAMAKAEAAKALFNKISKPIPPPNRIVR